MRHVLLTDEKIKVTHGMMDDNNMTRGKQYGVPDGRGSLIWKDLVDFTNDDFDTIEEYFIKTSAGNQTPSTETPSSSTKEEVERKLKIAIKALEKILQAQAIDGYIPTFKLPYSARIANDALSQINKGEPGK